MFDVRDNISRLITLRGNTSLNQIAKDSGKVVSQPLLSRFLLRPEEHNLSSKSLMGIADALGAEAWMLLVPDFPFDAIASKPLKKITHDGYRLLAVFESLPDDKRKAILDYVLFQINEAAPGKAKQIRDTRTHYKALPRPDNTYPTCNEDFE